MQERDDHLDGAEAGEHPLEDFLLREGLGGSVQSAFGMLAPGARGARWLVRLRNSDGRYFEAGVVLPTAHRIWLEGADVALGQAGFEDARPGREFLPILMEQRLLGLAIRWSTPAPPDLAEALEVLAADAITVAGCADYWSWCQEQAHDPTESRSREEFEACRRVAAGLLEFLGERGFTALLAWVRETN